jgi:hypothetical protein
MSEARLDPKTRNNDVGLYFRRSRRVVVDAPFGELATWIKSIDGGDVIWKNTKSGETNIWNFEAGETIPLTCDIILSGATIAGTPETTASANMIWASSPADLS